MREKTLKPVRFIWGMPWKKISESEESVVVILRVLFPSKILNALWLLLAVGRLSHAGFKNDSQRQIAILGNPKRITDDAFGQLLPPKAIWWAMKTAWKPSTKRRVEKQMRNFYDAAMRGTKRQTPPEPRPYTYKPGPPKMTPEELREHIDAVNRGNGFSGYQL